MHLEARIKASLSRIVRREVSLSHTVRGLSMKCKLLNTTAVKSLPVFMRLVVRLGKKVMPARLMPLK